MSPVVSWLAVAFCFLVNGLAIAKGDDENLCGPSEVEVASCSLEGKDKKIVSICANEKSKQAYYYFGTRDEIELSLTFSLNNKMYRWLDSVTYVTFLGFNQKGYSYVVGVPQETFGAKAFLFVKESKVSLDFNSPRFCTSNSFGEKSFVSDAIEDIDDETVRNGGFIFPPNSKVNSSE
jgi:hypothetical protein